MEGGKEGCQKESEDNKDEITAQFHMDGSFHDRGMKAVRKKSRAEKARMRMILLYDAGTLPCRQRAMTERNRKAAPKPRPKAKTVWFSGGRLRRGSMGVKGE